MSSRKSSGLPPVSSWQAAQKASSASGDRARRTNPAAAPLLRGAGRIHGATRGSAPEPGSGAPAEGGRPDHSGQRVGDDLDQEARIVSRVLVPEADDDPEA